MAYKVISVYRRPNTSVQWHTKLAFDPELDEKIRVFCFQNHKGKHIRSSVELDPLTLEFTQIWESKEAYEAIRYSPLMLEKMALTQKYWEDNNIIVEPQIKEEIDFFF